MGVSRRLTKINGLCGESNKFILGIISFCEYSVLIFIAFCLSESAVLDFVDKRNFHNILQINITD